MFNWRSTREEEYKSRLAQEVTYMIKTAFFQKSTIAASQRLAALTIQKSLLYAEQDM